MNRKKIIPALIVLIVIGAGIAYWKMSDHASEAVPLYGNVDIREVNLAFRVGGRVAEVKVDEGDRITPGQILARLDTAPLENMLHTAQAQLASVSARNTLFHEGYRSEDIAQASAKLQAARAALTQSEADLERQQTLVPVGASAQRALEAALSARDQAKAQRDAAEAALNLNSRGFRKQEIAESDGLLQQAQANVDSAKLALSDAVLLAPSAGTVLTRVIEKGAMVQVGSPAFSVSLTQPVWVRAYVPEPQLGSFNSGAKVELSTDSRPGKPYHGVVGFVSPTAEFTPKSVETTDLRTSLVYRLRVVVQDPDEQLRQGMPVTVKRAP
jgi:HlyD family secretion protein